MVIKMTKSILGTITKEKYWLLHTILFNIPEVTNMNNDKCTRTRETEQALAVGTNVDKMTNPAARMETMFDKREYA